MPRDKPIPKVYKRDVYPKFAEYEKEEYTKRSNEWIYIGAVIGVICVYQNPDEVGGAFAKL